MRALVVGVALAAATSWPVVAVALWADAPVTVESDVITADRVPAPTNFKCNNVLLGLGVLGIDFKWNAVQGATSYTLHYGPGGSVEKIISGSATSTRLTEILSSGTAWVNANMESFRSEPSNTASYAVALLGGCA